MLPFAIGYAVVNRRKKAFDTHSGLCAVGLGAAVLFRIILLGTVLLFPRRKSNQKGTGVETPDASNPGGFLAAAP